ncbi:hypothetical protein CPB86DRAFT_554513 [Serendipita vermifera]|nr:hypothetical protein CPB86DRAFT_554513 [Serendipita vermifera]
MESWNELTALAVFMNSFSDFMTIDDGDTVMAADKVFGALVVKVLKALDPDFIEKGEVGLPDLEFSLRSMADVGEMTSDFGGGKYAKIIKNYARRLFGQQSQEHRQARVEAIKTDYQKFYQALPEDRKQEYVERPTDRARDDEDEDEDEDFDEDDGEEEAGIPWFGKFKPQDANYNIQSFPLANAWKEYRELRAGGGYVPLFSQHGKPVCDLTKWPESVKQRYSFDDF